MDTTTLPRPKRTSGWSTPSWQRALPLLGVAIVFLVWTLGYRFTRYLPPPTEVVGDAAELITHGETYGHIIASVRRLLIGLSGGFLAAFLVAMAMRVNEWWRRFFQPYVFVALTIPSLAVALFALMIFGLSEIGVYVSVGVIVFPFIVVSLDEGFANLDARLSDMARAYRFSSWQRIRHVALPEMTPYLFSSLRNSYALAWKIVVITEVFSQQIGIGSEYKRSYDYFQLSQLVVWVVFFLIVVFAVEFGVFRPWERRVFRWRSGRGDE